MLDNANPDKGRLESCRSTTKIPAGTGVCVISTAGINLIRQYNNYYVYLLTNWNNRVMYVGVTNDLARRMYEHKNKLVKGFTEKYSIHKLVYFEETSDVYGAISREKEIKKWRREKKNKLVMCANPEWKDLSLEWE